MTPFLAPRSAKSAAKPLVGTVQCKNFGFFLRFVEPISQVLDHFHGRVGVALQHVKISLAMHAENAHVSHRLCRAWMAAAVEGRCVAAEQIAGHQHFQRAFLAIRRGFHAFDRAFFDDVKIFGRIAFTKDEVVLPITGF